MTDLATVGRYRVPAGLSVVDFRVGNVLMVPTTGALLGLAWSAKAAHGLLDNAGATQADMMKVTGTGGSSHSAKLDLPPALNAG